jgi:ribonuclease HI
LLCSVARGKSLGRAERGLRGTKCLPTLLWYQFWGNELTRARVKIFFDGGCRPNPGRMEIAVVARGVVHLRQDLGIGTNMDAEWIALIEALRIGQALGVAEFELLGDAAVVINQANGLWPCRSPELIRHQTEFATIAASGPPARIRRVARAQNLAGIALARLHPR